MPANTSTTPRATARKMVNQISLPLSLPIPLWAFFFGQISTHFWHWKHSPFTDQLPASGRVNLLGNNVYKQNTLLHIVPAFSVQRKSAAWAIKKKLLPLGTKTGRKTDHKVPCLQECQLIRGYRANNRPDEPFLLAAWKRHPTDSSPLNRCIHL